MTDDDDRRARLGIIELGEADLLRMLLMPEGYELVGVHGNFRCRTIDVMVRSDQLRPVVEGCQPPILHEIAVGRSCWSVQRVNDGLVGLLLLTETDELAMKFVRGHTGEDVDFDMDGDIVEGVARRWVGTDSRGVKWILAQRLIAGAVEEG